MSGCRSVGGARQRLTAYEYGVYTGLDETLELQRYTTLGLLNTTKSYTYEWLSLCYVSLTSVKKKSHPPKQLLSCQTVTLKSTLIPEAAALSSVYLETLS